ncbi:glycoside hydrolase family 65 protein [Caldicellulosiruptoraceae bacterium PP1]
MKTLPKKQPIFANDGWKVVENGFDEKNNFLSETIFTVANGYFGLRGNLEEPFYDKKQTFKATYINGFYENYDITYPEGGYGFAKIGEAMVNLADVKSTKISIDGEEFSIFSGKIIEHKRELDLREGILKREILWESPSNKRTFIQFERLAHLKYQHLGIIKIKINPINFSGNIKVISSIDGNSSNMLETEDVRVGSGVEKFPFKTLKTWANSLSGFLMQETKKSKLAYGCFANHILDFEAQCNSKADIEKNLVIFEISFNASKNREYSIIKYFSYYTERDLSKELIEQNCINEVSNAITLGYEKLLSEHKDFIDKFWNISDIEIDGFEGIQQAIRFNLFSLLQSTGRNGISNIAAKGLTGEGYGGHYFWDSEIYILPFFTYTNPEIAKKLLIYRYNLLDAARDRAKELHHKGALYPWRTIAGSECSAYFPAGTAQYHINADIVFAIKRYFEATNDIDFILKYGAEIIFETARFYVSLGSYSQEKNGKFCIHCVTGPDEYTALVDNNAYTNYMAKMNLEYAVYIYDLMKNEYPEVLDSLRKKINLEQSEVNEFKTRAKDMYLPYNEKLKIIPQDDTFLSKKRIDLSTIPEDQFPLLLNWHYLDIYRLQVCKQPDVLLAIFLLRDLFSYEDLKNNYEYYEPVTTHDSSLSPAVFGILATELGLLDKAFEYFRYTVRMDLDDLNNNTKDGIHAACMGGSWMGLIYGFAGMRTKNNKLYFAPKLPKELTYISFKIKFRNSDIKIEIYNNKAIYTLIEGDEIVLSHYNIQFSLAKEESKEFLIE